MDIISILIVFNTVVLSSLMYFVFKTTRVKDIDKTVSETVTTETRRKSIPRPQLVPPLGTSHNPSTPDSSSSTLTSFANSYSHFSNFGASPPVPTASLSHHTNHSHSNLDLLKDIVKHSDDVQSKIPAPAVSDGTVIATGAVTTSHRLHCPGELSPSVGPFPKIPLTEREQQEWLHKKECADALYRSLFRRNRKFVKQMKEQNPNFFQQLAAVSQSPKFLFLGCCDSRVPAEQITGLGPGQLFVHRNISNLVVANDMNFMSILQYAVEVLNVEHIIVCGHYGCGGIIQAQKMADTGLLEHWLRNIRDVHRLHCDELQAIENPEARTRRLVELNVREQCINLLKTGIVQRRLKSGQYLRIHGMVYELSEGLLKEVELRLDEYIKRYQHIYKMYESEEQVLMEATSAIRESVTGSTRDLLSNEYDEDFKTPGLRHRALVAQAPSATSGEGHAPTTPSMTSVVRSVRSESVHSAPPDLDLSNPLSPRTRSGDYNEIITRLQRDQSGSPPIPHKV